jgi:hypothetical protein
LDRWAEGFRLRALNWMLNVGLWFCIHSLLSC